FQTGKAECARRRERRGQEQSRGLFSDAPRDGGRRFAVVCHQQRRSGRLFLQRSKGNQTDQRTPEVWREPIPICVKTDRRGRNEYSRRGNPLHRRTILKRLAALGKWQKGIEP